MPSPNDNGSCDPEFGSAAAASGLPEAEKDSAASFTELFEHSAPAVYAWAALHLRRPLRASVDPEDVLQEVACRAFENFDRYDAERGDYRSWLFGIARHVLYQALDRLRVGAGSEEHALDAAHLDKLPDKATSITRRLARNDTIQTLLRFIEGMPDEDRRLILYRGLEGLSHEQVALRMNLSVEAVTQRWSRLRTRLQQRDALAVLAVS